MICKRLFIVLLCCSSSAVAEPVPKLRIGVVESLTGIAAEDGKTVVQALELAVADIKRKTGQEIELQIEDDQTTAKNTVSAFKRLANSAPSAIIGATWDFTTNPVLPLALQSKTVLFNTSALPESLDVKSAAGFAFVNSISSAEEAVPFKNYTGTLRGASLAIVYANNSWGETQLRTYSAIAKSNGLTVVAELKPASYDENEWRDLTLKVKAQAPDVILLLLNKNDLTLFMRRAREIALKGKFFASKNAFDAIEADPSHKIFEGLCFTYPLERIRAEGEFSQAYRARFGEEPRIYADNTYDALFILARAWDISRSKGISMRDSLPQVTYRGLVGDYSFHEERSFSTGTSSLVCVENGSLVAAS